MTKLFGGKRFKLFGECLVEQLKKPTVCSEGESSVFAPKSKITVHFSF